MVAATIQEEPMQFQVTDQSPSTCMAEGALSLAWVGLKV